MRAARSLLPAFRLAFDLARRTGSLLREALLLGALVAAVELAGAYTPHDGGDLIVLIGALLAGLLLREAARAGWLPATQDGARWLVGAAKRAFQRLSPRYAVAFRPGPAPPALPDRTLFAPLVALCAATLALALLGEGTFHGLLFVKTHASYVVYLALLLAVWSLLAVGVAFGSLAAAHWLQSAARGHTGLRALAPFALFALGWIGGLVALTLLPGATPLVFLLLVGWWRGRRLRQLPGHTYLFCRRDAQGRARALPVHLYLQRAHAAVVLTLAVIMVLGQGQRLWIAEWPSGPFAFTTWLGVLASLCALLLVVRAGAHFERLLGGGGVPPEVPLTPTLWIPRAGDALAAEAADWRRIAREHGWLVLTESDRPEREFDLVLGGGAHPRRFLPRPAADDADAFFQLERRFHVVMRRRFHRHFQSLYKQLRAGLPSKGSGFLFCPHVWLVPGVVRDVEPTKGASGSTSSLAGPALHGPPYAKAFPERVRRYIGAALRTLEIDIVFWEDAITWRDLRRVLGVAFEILDQGRAPLLERHFVGLPRVRIVIQDEQAETETRAGWQTGAAEEPAPAAAGHARILLVLRDRGGQEDILTPSPADSWIRTPSLV